MAGINSQNIFCRTAAVTTAALFLNTTPGLAADHIERCRDYGGYPETATLVVHPRQLGIEAGATDADVFTDDFEIQFNYRITIRQHDDNAPNVTGPVFCEFEGGFERDYDMPSVRIEFMNFVMNDIIYVENIPRYSRADVEIWARELDDLVDDDLDFNFRPGQYNLNFTVYVNSGRARSLVGAAENRDDITLNSAKRLVGDGAAYPGDIVGDTYRAYLEFVTNVHPDNWVLGTPQIAVLPPLTGNIVAPQQPTIIPKPPKVEMIPGQIFGSDAICQNYSSTAADLAVEAGKLGCGFQPPVWNNDVSFHYNWCMHGDNFKTAGSYNVKRSADLKACAANKPSQPKPDLGLCAIYAAEATSHALQAQKLGCGFTGPRWGTDFAAHAAWCAVGADPNVLVAETASRASEVAACALTKDKP